MKKILLLSSTILFTMFTLKAQTAAMQFNGNDCFDQPVDLFADLDAGKAAVLFYYMPLCGSCPPPAASIQEMVYNILDDFPGMVTAYAFPFQNSTTCDYSASWVNDNDLDLYHPMDSGALQVAYYGGFGMPTVVLVGGLDHRVMFSTLSFVNSDTTEMRDSILNLLGAPTTAVNEFESTVTQFQAYPNPVNESLEINIDLIENAAVRVELVDLTGHMIDVLKEQNTASGSLNLQYNTSGLPNGIYFVRLIANGNSVTRKIVVAH